jgi:hypothetical protein
MAMPPKTLVCCAASFSYGPASKLVTIAEAARSVGLRTVFLGTGIAHELAARTSAFDDIVRAAPEDQLARRTVDAACAVLSLMEREYLCLAQERSKPTYVADSLFWMRDHPPAVFLRARRYWVQEFVGVRERVSESPSAPTVVGPIVRPMRPAGDTDRGGVVVTLGGCDSPLSGISGDPSYFDFIIGGVLRSDLMSTFTDQVLLMAGSRCVEYLAGRYPGSGITFISASPREAASVIETAAMVLAAPGLTTSLECFQVAAPTFFLPPQNYSHWWILKKLRDMGVAGYSFHWEDLLPGYPVGERMSEHVRVPLIRSAIRSLVQQERAARAFGEALAGYLSCDRTALASKQRGFFRSLGPNGVSRIVDDLAELC